MKILVNGAQGKMGQTTTACIDAQDDMHLVATCDQGDDLKALLQAHAPDIVIDFTNADSVWKNLQIILDNGARPVIGSSGLTEEQIKTATALCDDKKIGCIIAPNFALGAILMMKYTADAARYFDDVEIIEYHHPGKLDAPSGTAIKTAEMISENRKNESPRQSKELLPGALGATHKGVPIHSLRLTGTIANQAVTFGAPGQTLTIRHDSLDRESFMPGVLLACRKVMSSNSLVYGLENLL